MRRRAVLPAAAVLVGLLTACTAPLLTPDERKEVCQVVAAEKFGAPAFEPNVLSNPAGGFAGAGLGALKGLWLTGDPRGAIVTVPIGAVIGAVGGSACAIAALAHPTADADFEGMLRAAEIGVLARTVVAQCNAPRDECCEVRARRESAADPDAVIEIDKVRAGMACVFGRMEYWIAVDWRTVSLRSKREISLTRTRCTLVSSRSVDDWFADRAYAQKEIEGAFAATGRRMALQLLSDDVLRGECRLQSSADGAVSP